MYILKLLVKSSNLNFFVIVLWKPPMLGEGRVHAVQGAGHSSDFPKVFSFR